MSIVLQLSIKKTEWNPECLLYFESMRLFNQLKDDSISNKPWILKIGLKYLLIVYVEEYYNVYFDLKSDYQ